MIQSSSVEFCTRAKVYECVSPSHVVFIVCMDGKPVLCLHILANKLVS